MALPAIAGLPAVLSWLFGFILIRAILKLFVLLGVAVVTVNGMDSLFDNMRQIILDQFPGMPTQMIQILGVLRLDQAIEIIFVALAVKNPVTSIVLASAQKYIGGNS